ncbi:MAG TPA: TIGR04282 family arsenosugar biosynthesis glycosyltransferase [Pseudolabrys sp.]|nr:TIGR04282 family arsenosugar biosynthesis glycosyltransferase [Pseudolabrys sp.]
MPPSASVAIAVLSKAPIPGFAKTRLIPSIGAHAAAVLQERLTERAVTTACAADTGPVTLWCAPSLDQASFQDLARRFPIALRRQPDGDLGNRMLGAIAAHSGPTLVIGADCPALTAEHLRAAARALDDADVVLVPAEDGGYVLIGARAVHIELFSNIAWGTPAVLDETRARIRTLKLTATELPALWDVDTEADLALCEKLFPEIAL